MQSSWFWKVHESEIIRSFIVMQISNALTQVHPTDINTVHHHFFNNGGNHWAMLVRLLIYIYLQHNIIHASKSRTLNSALFSQLVDTYQKRIEYKYDTPSTSIQ